MSKTNHAEMLCKAIDTYGLIEIVGYLWGEGAKISLPFYESTCKLPIEQLNLSVRSFNCLKKMEIVTIDKLVDAIQENKLWQIRNLGKKSLAEIRVATYQFGYDCLSSRDKLSFAQSLLQLNSENC